MCHKNQWLLSDENNMTDICRSFKKMTHYKWKTIATQSTNSGFYHESFIRPIGIVSSISTEHSHARKRINKELME